MRHLEAEWVTPSVRTRANREAGPPMTLSLMDDPPSPFDFSSEELAWLKASQILDAPPSLPPKDSVRQSFTSTEINPSFSRSSADSVVYAGQSLPSSSSADIPATRSSNPQRSEWIYRQPRPPISGRSSSTASTDASPRVGPRLKPSMGYQSPTLSSLSRKVPSTDSRKTHRPSARSFDSCEMTEASSSTSTGPFWSTILHPRSRSERSMPLLRTIPSESQLSLNRSERPEASGSACPSTPKKNISSPMTISCRPSSISSMHSNTPISSSSPSPASSRSESPITPISLSSSPYGAAADNLVRRRHTSHRTQNHRRHRATTSVEGGSSVSSCPPPSRSILTRTASVSTKDSSHTVNKSVKFAANPTVHYAAAGYWDVEAVDEFDHTSMGINVESMDLDDDPFANYGARHNNMHTQFKLHKTPTYVHRLDAAKVRELQCQTPTPERERERANGLKRLVSINRRPSSTSRKPASPTSLPRTPSISLPSPSPSPCPSPPRVAASNRPQISIPYALGGHPHPGMQSTASLRAAGQQLKRNTGGSAGKDHYSDVSVSDFSHERGSVPLRSAPSMESFRSSKSAAARSVRSLSGSVKSSASTKGLRAWFERTLGWAES